MKNKIITIIPSLYNGGAEKIVADLSIGLSKVFDLTTIVYNQTDQTYTQRGQLIELDIPQKNTILLKLWRQLKIIKRLKRIKQSKGAKVVISHMLMANMLNILSRKNEATVCVLHGEWSVKTGKFIFLKWFVKRQYKKADRIISVSNYIKDMFDTYYRLDVPHDVIHIGVPIQEIEKKSMESIGMELPNHYLVYVAGFRPVKNHVQLLDQIESYLKTYDISLVFVGDGPLRGAIEKNIKAKDLSDKVILLGNVNNPYPVIKNAKLSLLVSSSESFSLVVLESMVLGVPVIATDCGGPRELIAPEWNDHEQLPYESDYGILIDKTEVWDSNTLVAQIQRLLSDETKWQQLSENGRERAKHFSLAHTEEQYEQLLFNLIAEKGTV